VRQDFPGGRLNREAAPFDFPEEHRALNRGDAEVSQFFRIGLPDEPPSCLLSDKKCRQFILCQLEDKTEVLAD
jgi:hypothetical protein